MWRRARPRLRTAQAEPPAPLPACGRVKRQEGSRATRTLCPESELPSGPGSGAGAQGITESQDGGGWKGPTEPSATPC